MRRSIAGLASLGLLLLLVLTLSDFSPATSADRAHWQQRPERESRHPITTPIVDDEGADDESADDEGDDEQPDPPSVCCSPGQPGCPSGEGVTCCATGEWACDAGGQTTCEEVSFPCEGCCDPAAEPGQDGIDACPQGATCCPSGSWECNAADGSPACSTVGRICCADFQFAPCSIVGCPAGQVCHTGTICVPSSCSCDSATGMVICTTDCGGGVCVPVDHGATPTL